MTRTRLVVALLTGLALLAAGPDAPGAAEDPGGGHHAAPQAGDHPAAPQAGDHPAAPQAGDHHAAPQAEVNTNPLEFQKDLALWTAVVFLVLAAVLWRFAWGPIAGALEKREKGIADQFKAADEAETEAQQKLVQYDQKLAAAKDEVRAILDQARHDGEQLGRDLVEKARAEAQTQKQQALEQIDAAAAAAIKELADRGAQLAVELAGKIVGQKLSAADHAQLIRQAVGRFAAGEPSNN